MLVQNSTYTLEPFNVQANVASTLVTEITYPDGVSYSSHELTGGVFDGDTWTIVGYQPKDAGGNPIIRTLTITVEITDIALFSALALEDRCVLGSTDVLIDEVVVVNNEAEKCISEETCIDLLTCAGIGLQEFDSMAEATLILGEGKPFLYSLANTDGATYRGLHITPFS